MMITGTSGRRSFNLLQQIQPGCAGHADVAHHHLRGVGFQRGQGILGGGEGAELDLFPRQRLFEHPADGVVIVDDPDGFHNSQS